MGTLLHPIRLLWAASSYVIFAVLGALIGYVLLPLGTLGMRDPESRVRRGQRILSACCRVWIGYMTLGGLLRLRRPRALEIDEPMVIVANHPSLLDIIMLLAVVPNITFLAKASWFSSPFIGPLLRFGHHIAGPEGGSDASPMDGAMVLDRILTQLRAGYPVMLFPEGTRSPANGLGPFKRGAFEAAVRAGVPLCCLRVRVDPPVLLKGQPWWKVPKRRISFEVSMLQTIAPEAFGDSARRLCGDVRHAYLHALELQ